MMLSASPPKKVRVGGPDWEDTASLLPDGPKNRREIYQGPRKIFEILFGPRIPGGEDYATCCFNLDATSKIRINSK